MANPNNNFHGALVRCGFIDPTADHLIDEGIADTNTLLLATHDDIDTIARTVNRSPAYQQLGVSMAFISVKRMKGFRFWADECIRTGYEADPNVFDDDAVDAYTTKLANYQALAKSFKNDYDKPDPITKMTKWRKFDEPLRNYLSQYLSADSKTWLTYLIWEDEDTLMSSTWTPTRMKTA
eukprot:CAMPEP_0202460696 /NCGR_PEP_ID=MMETSP1360-20130828/45403_1 /ASSEMBLY_ACC=CAM_ASM_000848 /TAXON_ID=515479 /ORGANISM="Licmophora paradoxa, Strain CCMP2313" /LENGTH=179 /DNA_ID=CAMNT_0049082463 /DNA_START=121 /DNA_END=657 /DNA_ORIENTATION=+